MVSSFVANNLTYTRRKDIKLYPLFYYIILDIDKSELNAIRNISLVIVYNRPPNTDSSIFIKDMDTINAILSSENREIYMIRDFNYDTFKTSIYIN